ncbi:MAG: class I SAM-dependent methyltransferase [Promethearchaeota archaeon]
MEYYEHEKNVDAYIQMNEGYNGRDLITELTKYLPRDSSVLEIGMGPGTDLTILEKYYKVQGHVTGSDYSEIFIDRYRKQNPDADLVVLNEVTLKTDRKFDGLYSNKVLIHLTREELIQSIKRQAEILEPEGIICHSFWRGDKEEKYNGLLFIYYTAEQLQKLFEDRFDIIKIEKYKEMEPDDSLYIIARKK